MSKKQGKTKKKKSKYNPFVCGTCGSKNVNIAAFVNLNTLKYYDDLHDEPEYYCHNCNENCKPVKKSDYITDNKNE
jgi:hypothetical protein